MRRVLQGITGTGWCSVLANDSPATNNKNLTDRKNYPLWKVESWIMLRHCTLYRPKCLLNECCTKFQCRNGLRILHPNLFGSNKLGRIGNSLKLKELNLSQFILIKNWKYSSTYLNYEKSLILDKIIRKTINWNSKFNNAFQLNKNIR